MLRQVIYDVTRPIFIKQMVWAVLFWVVTIIVILLNLRVLHTLYPDPVRPSDLLLDLIPETKAFVNIAEYLSSLQVLIMAYVMVQWHFRPLPKLLFLVAFMFFLRSFAFNLTPLGQIHPPSENYPQSHFIAQTFYHGMFFSGHTASAFIQAFYIRGHRLRPLALMLAGLQAISLIVSHSHYSIDVFGGLFVAYFITHYDFMRLVPNQLRHVKWMPWYDEKITELQNSGLPVLE